MHLWYILNEQSICACSTVPIEVKHSGFVSTAVYLQHLPFYSRITVVDIHSELSALIVEGPPEEHFSFPAEPVFPISTLLLCRTTTNSSH